MARPFKHKMQRTGYPITGRSLRQLAETANYATNIDAEGPLEVVSSGGGAVISYPGAVFSAYIAITAEDIPARSGETCGGGDVTIQTVDYDGNLRPLGRAAYKAFNISDASGGIPSGTHCIVLNIASRWFIITAECANINTPTPTPTPTPTGTPTTLLARGGERDRQALERDAGLPVDKGSLDVPGP